MRFAEGVDHIVEVEADLLGFFEEGLAGGGDECEAFVAAGKDGAADDHPDAGAAGEIAGGFQLADDLVGGGGADFQFLAHGADGGKGVTRHQLSDEDRFADGS